jgi:hypothetical protein
MISYENYNLQVIKIKICAVLPDTRHFNTFHVPGSESKLRQAKNSHIFSSTIVIG